MHIHQKVSEPVKAFTFESWIKYIKCAIRWAKVDCDEGKIAIEEMALVGINILPELRNSWSVRQH